MRPMNKAMLFITVLICGSYSTQAQSFLKGVSFGSNYQVITESKEVGFGFHLQKEFSDKWSLQIGGNYYSPIDYRDVFLGGSISYTEKKSFAELSTKYNFINKSKWSLYSEVGIALTNKIFRGMAATYNDVGPDPQIRTFDIDIKELHWGAKLGGGIEYGNNIKVFLEPSMFLLDQRYINVTSGIRFSLQ